MNKQSFLAIIPARGGSKRLPGKNIMPLNGKPLICWTFEAANKSKYISDIAISSDCSEIIETVKKCGAEVHFKRPKEIATDSASTIEVILHTIAFYKKELNKVYDYIILLQPTSPLRKTMHIDESIDLLFSKNADAIISVCETEHSPLWCNTLRDDLNLDNFLSPDVINKRSQDLQTYYRINGAIYICKTEKVEAEKKLFLDKNVFAYVMPKNASIDIDDEMDFKLAELLV